MIKSLLNITLLMLGFLICHNLLLSKAFGGQRQFGIHGNIIRAITSDDKSWKLKTGYGAGGQIRYWWKDCFFGSDLEYFRNGVDWSEHGDRADHLYEHKKNTNTIELSPYAGSDLLPDSPINLIFIFGAGLYWSAISNLHQIYDTNSKKYFNSYEWKPGLNFGFSFEIPRNKKSAYAVSLKYHLLLNDSKKAKFFTLSGGVVL